MSPHRAVLRQAPAGTFALPPALAGHAHDLAAGDHLRARGQEIFEECAPAMAVASDIGELGHYGPVKFPPLPGNRPLMSLSAREHESGRGWLFCRTRPRLGNVTPLGLEARASA